jgi:hypothetical protein
LLLCGKAGKDHHAEDVSTLGTMRLVEHMAAMPAELFD